MKNNYRIEGGVVFMECTFEGDTVEVMVDESSFALLQDYPGKWHGHRSSKNLIYIRSNLDPSGNKKKTYLHRYLTNCPKGLVVDHINHNTLDNRLSNLREVPQRINMLNHKKTTGVSYKKDRDNWCARITIKRKEIFLGYFGSYQEALRARKHAEDFYKKEWLHE
jgi:hypothetical protein